MDGSSKGELMPAVKLLSDAKIGEMKALRGKGLTIRTIARMMDIPRATVHHYVRHVAVNSNAELLSENALDVDQLGIHLPYSLVCPSCGLEQPHITFCVQCGAVWMGECGHGGDVVGGRHQGINLGEVVRRPGDGYLYVNLLEPGEDEGI